MLTPSHLLNIYLHYFSNASCRKYNDNDFFSPSKHIDSVGTHSFIVASRFPRKKGTHCNYFIFMRKTKQQQQQQSLLFMWVMSIVLMLPFLRESWSRRMENPLQNKSLYLDRFAC